MPEAGLELYEFSTPFGYILHVLESTVKVFDLFFNECTNIKMEVLLWCKSLGQIKITPAKR